MKEGGWSLLGSGLVVHLCCVAAAAASLAGVTSLSFGVLTRIEATLLPYLAIMAVVLLGRAHYLLHVKHQGNRVSHVVTWAATLLIVTLWGIRWVE